MQKAAFRALRRSCFAGVLFWFGSSSRCNKRGRPLAPTPPATASAAADSLQTLNSGNPWAAGAPIRGFARSGNSYDAHPPTRPPIPPDPQLAPAPASAAYPAAPSCAETVRKPQHKAPGRCPFGERLFPPHRSRYTLPSHSAGSRLPADTPATRPADVPGRHSFLRTLPQVP